jgi:threonine aldolase
MKIIDLRSDTVTLPTPEMRAAMAQAIVGDDVYGEDATINQLQEMAAELMGKASGLFLPSGTMGNLIAVMVHCGRGDEVILGNLGHTYLLEAGGVAALGGVHPYILKNQPDGTLDVDEIKGAIRSQDVHFPTSRLVMLENTHNRCGGIPLTAEYTKKVANLAHENGMTIHLDGARIFNAAISLAVDVKALTNPTDSVTFCLSKGLCAPVGSVLCGSTDFIQRARRIRKQLGGGMRQAGFLAAAGIIALKSMVERLKEDHQRAKALAQGLRKIPGLYLNPESPATNMVFVQLDGKDQPDAHQVAEKLSQYGVRVGVVGPQRLRMVLHHDIDDSGVVRTIEAFGAIL